jgi:hypothetical protein
VFGGDANGMALKALNNTVRIQGLVMSFEDVFLVLTVLFLAMACGTPLIRRPRAAAPARAGPCGIYWGRRAPPGSPCESGYSEGRRKARVWTSRGLKRFRPQEEGVRRTDQRRSGRFFHRQSLSIARAC